MFARGISIWEIRAQVGGLHRLFLAANVYAVNRPSWSPDGKWIAFGISDDYGSIAVIPSRGGAPRYVTESTDPDPSDPGGSVDDSDPAWSPDGTLLAFTRVVWLCDVCDQDEIFTATADGSESRWITTDTSYAVGRPSWSPNGDRLVAESSGEVQIFSLTGQPLRAIDPEGTEPAWQPLG